MITSLLTLALHMLEDCLLGTRGFRQFFAVKRLEAEIEFKCRRRCGGASVASDSVEGNKITLEVGFALPSETVQGTAISISLLHLALW
jgi:hypothetical protein